MVSVLVNFEGGMIFISKEIDPKGNILYSYYGNNNHPTLYIYRVDGLSLFKVILDNFLFLKKDKKRQNVFFQNYDDIYLLDSNQAVAWICWDDTVFF